MKANPGSWLWLLRNELRLNWRGIGGSHFWFIAVAGGLLWVFMHLGAWVMMPEAGNLSRIMLRAPILVGGLFWVFVSLIVSQTMTQTVTALIDRGDLDLLLSSPLSQRTIFLVRGFSIAVGASLLPAYALLPLAHAGLFRGFPGLMAVYPVVIATALGCTATGILLTMTLLRLLGARRARIAGQVFAAFIGVAFFLAFQIPNALSVDTKKIFLGWVNAGLQESGLFGSASPLWWPVHAMLGEVLPLLAVMVIGIGGFWLVINLTYRRFITGTQETITGGRASSPAAKGDAGPVFRAGFVRVLLFKEWKLLIRDMHVISQSLMQILYLIPLLLLGYKSGPLNLYLIPALVATTAMLAGNLAWVTINAEDAPELVATAPVSIAKVLRIKAAAAVLPILAVLLPLTAWWFLRGPRAAATLLVCGTGAMLSAALVQIWSPRAANRSDLKNRYKRGGPAGYIELLSTVGWTGIAACVGGYWNWLPLAAAVVAAAILSAWFLGRSAREAIGYV